MGIGPACCEGLARVAKVLIRASGLGIYDLSLFFFENFEGRLGVSDLGLKQNWFKESCCRSQAVSRLGVQTPLL